ncbi:MAG: CHAD domain-containing protein, partial [Terriglobales bacterium]
MAPDSNRTQALFDKLLRISRLSSGAKPETVHQLRTTIRRVETLLATTLPALGRKEQKLLKQLGRLRRRAGKVRDVDVQIQALGSLRLESIARDRARVMAFLEKARAKRESKLLQAFQDEADGGLHKRLKRTAAHLQGELLRPAQPGSDEQRFLTAALDKFAAVVKQYPTLSEGNLHSFRMASKRVRYLAEMAGEGPRVAAVIEPFKRIQDAIGVWHDWLTLTATAESVLAPSEQAPLLGALRASTRSKYLEALRITSDAQRALLELYESQRTAGKPVSRSAPEAVTPAATAATA